MKHVALVFLATFAIAQSAAGHSPDFRAHPHSYATAPRMSQIIIVPVYSGRSVYAGVPVSGFRLIGPSWSDLQMSR